MWYSEGSLAESHVFSTQPESAASLPGWSRSQGKTEPSKGRPAGLGGVLFVIAVILSPLFADLQGSVSSHGFPAHLGTVELAIEVIIQVVSLVRHQGAEWPIGRWDATIA